MRVCSVAGVRPNEEIQVRAIGRVSSPITDPLDAPRQGDEGAPLAAIEIEPDLLEALHGIQRGDVLLVLTWLDRADRNVLSVHPRGDPARERLGVFATRSPDRPNPIGLHRVRLESIDGTTLEVSDLEAIDGTPVLDVKPVLSGEIGER